MEFRQIEAFVNVVKYKSFSKAASASFLTQPTISNHISALESELGVKLVDRVGKESRLTKEGRQFYAYALSMINTRKKALEAMEDASQNISGIINICASSIPGEYLVPKLMAGFREKYPDVQFYMEQSDSHIVWDKIRSGECDIGFTGDYIDNTLGYNVLFSDRSVVITPKSKKFKELAEKSNVISIKELMDEPFLFREDGSATRKTFEEALNRYGRSITLNVAATINTLEGIKQCVSQGMGISIVSKVVAEEDAPYFTFQLAEMEYDRDFYLTYNKEITMSPTVTRFSEFVLEQYQGG